jgi:AAA domain/Nucleoside diphosphate kinase
MTVPLGDGPVVVIGLPCVGKSTLGSLLARCLGRRHVSVGDLIRAARNRGQEWPTAAYAGRREYPEEFIARILAEALSPAEMTGTLAAVIDGGPPLDRVLLKAGVRPALTLLLSADPRIREARFGRRMLAGCRPGEHLELFRQRTALFEEKLPGTARALGAAAPLLTLDAADEPRHLVREALSALLLAGALPAACDVIPVPAADLDLAAKAALALARSGAAPVIADLGPSRDPSKGPEPVLLIKPGHAFTTDLISQIGDRTASFGYAVRQIAVWPGSAVGRWGLAAAHHDRHSLYSRYASHLLSANLAGGHELVARGEGAALEGWEDAHPVQVAKCVWRARLVLGDGTPTEVVNGHMPRIEQSFENGDVVVVALRLRRSSAHPGSWSDLRRSFLGATDPGEARPRSLRHDAARGLLALTGQISMQNNAFHLSAGPLEAMREGFLWFQDMLSADASAVRLAVDGTTSLGRSFVATEEVDWENGSRRVAAALLTTVPDYCRVSRGDLNI